jgi:hydroxymethylbilane synthase
MKDMETRGPKELIIPCMLPRENPLDALVVRQDLKNIQNLSDLPQGCRVGTSSVRRAAFLKNIRPDLQITPLRGNVHTRLEKLDSGQVQAVILAVAGLNRLGLESRIAAFLLPHEILPSAGQGAIGVEIHRENQDIISYFSQINDPETVTCVTLERAILHRLDGSCQTPIGAYARFLDQYIALSLSVASLDGVCRFDHTDIIENPHHDQLDEIGYDCANALLKKIKPESFLSIFKVPKQEE